MATLTITTTAAQDARIAAAFGASLILGRNATGLEVKAAVIEYVRSVVYAYETAQQATAAAAAVTKIAPT